MAGRAGPLTGRVVVTTRDAPGRLDRLLAEVGATVVHVPLIRVEPLASAQVDVDGAAWLVVTSQHGALAVGALARRDPAIRLAAVGSRTAALLAEHAGRAVDLVPERHTAADLVAAFPAGTGRVVAALGDLAGPALADGLTALGWSVDTSVVYRTVAQVPDPDVRAVMLAADAVAFASGSAAAAWATAIGVATPARVIAIGPTTARVARSHGLSVTHVAASHDVDGLADAVVAALHDAS